MESIGQTGKSEKRKSQNIRHQVPVSTHSIKGEKPLSEMSRHGLGEESRPAVAYEQHFAGRKLEDIYVLELFAGTARLTKSMKQKGFQAMAFDKSSKRAEGQTVLEADLSNKDEVESLISFIHMKANQLAFIHFAPPCGTASRARGKRLRF